MSDQPSPPQPLRRVLAIRHVAFEDLGGFVPLLIQRGFGIRYLDAGYEPLPADEIAACDLLVVLGGPIGANDDADYPVLAEELRVIEARLKAGKPLLGFCLGAQLMARALGARVYKSSAKEIGYEPVTLTEAGRASCLAPLEDVPVLHWHGDTFDLPDGARHLAMTEICPHQAFAWGKNDAALALQFHPEPTARDLERWLIGHTGELAAERISIPTLREAAYRHDTALRRAGGALLNRWLAQVAAP